MIPNDIIIDDEHIVSAVKEMSVSSSAGPDGLPSSFLKNCLPVLIVPNLLDYPAVLAQIATLLVVCLKALCLVHCYS